MAHQQVKFVILCVRHQILVDDEGGFVRQLSTLVRTIHIRETFSFVDLDAIFCYVFEVNPHKTKFSLASMLTSFTYLRSG
jgi:hypothetical protein